MLETAKKFVRNGIIIFGIIILVLGIYFYFKNRKNPLYELVVENRYHWDLFSIQNTMLSGEYMGAAYEQNYTINTLSKEILTSLIVDYYIYLNPDFYTEDYYLGSSMYQKKVSDEEIKETQKIMFGPDFNIDIEDFHYGCERSIEKTENGYIIKGKDIEACGILIDGIHEYLSFISNYHKKENQIIVELKVGYVDTVEKDYDELSEEEEEYIYSVYTDKTKKEIIQSNYDENCIFEYKGSKSCYDNFRTYLVTLEKASDENYYFSKIERQS